MKDLSANKPDNRISYIDVSRGLSMLCIIAGHMGYSRINHVVFTFHVPIFFIISGYFFREDREKVRKTCVKLIKPYIFTVLCVAVLDMLKQYIKWIVKFHSMDIQSGLKAFGRDLLAGLYGSGSRKDFLNFDLPSVGAIWFFLALIWAEIFVFMMMRMFFYKNSSQGHSILWPSVIAVFFWLIGFYTAKFTWLPLSIQSGLCAVPFLLVGMYLKRYNWMKKYEISKRGTGRMAFYIFLTTTAVIWGISVLFSFRNDHMSLVRSAFPDPVINITGAVAGTLAVFCIANKIDQTRIGCFLSYIGKNSMIVLSFHLIELNVIPIRGGVQYITGLDSGRLCALIAFVIKVLWCLSGVFITHKIKLLRWVYSLPGKC